MRTLRAGFQPEPTWSSTDACQEAPRETGTSAAQHSHFMHGRKRIQSPVGGHEVLLLLLLTCRKSMQCCKAYQPVQR